MARREERRLVTCLFIDVVGSTELTVSLGPERLKASLDAAFAALRGLIEREGGTVEKYVGDAIYAIFGSPVAHSDDPVRALRAAAGARDWALSRANSDIPFAVRIGVETGEAIVDLTAAETTRQQLSVGAVVNIAARLQQRAEPGQVLVGPVAREAATDAATFTPLGNVELKGIGRLEINELRDVDGTTRRDLPFVGRDGELELLRIAHGRAQRGRSVLALVSGPPGQGKTRLVGEFVASLGAIELAQARCRPGGEVGTLAPVRELLLGTRADDELEDVVADVVEERTERARIAEVLAHSAGLRSSALLTALGTDERNDEIVNAWTRYLRGLAARGTVVLWMEDVHWAAPDVVRLVDRISRSGVPVLVIATARPEFAEAAGIRPSGDRFFIELEGLDEEEARELARHAGSTDRPVERAAGNPLFIVELARGSSDELPVTLQGALGARLDELDPVERAVLAHGAVVGETFEAEDAAVLAGRDPATTSRSLRRLVDLHYLDQVDRRFRFHHSLLRDVAYGRLLLADRMRLHARYARELAHPEDAEVLAHHWWAALRPPDADWVWENEPQLPAMRREGHLAHLAAGRHHVALFAVDRATELLKRALALAQNASERAVAEHSLGDAYAATYLADESWEHYRLARAAYREAGTVPADFYPAPLKIRTRWGAFHRYPDVAEISVLVEEAEAAARASGDRRLVAIALLNRSLKREPMGDGMYDASALDEAVVEADASGDPATQRQVLGYLFDDAAQRCDVGESERLLERIERLRIVDSEVDRLELLSARSSIAFVRGDVAALEEIADEAASLARPMGPHLRSHAAALAGFAALVRGDWNALEGGAANVARLISESPGTKFCGMAALVLAYGGLAHGARGRTEEARAQVRQINALDLPFRQLLQVAKDLALLFTSETIGELPPAPSIDASAEWALVAVVRRRHADAERLAERMAATAATGGRGFAAIAEAVREELAHDAGGPEPRHAALRQIGYLGISELLRRRVDAEV
ncbi:MAG TPA: adenylate/guanylate cyclase domain-containing protein [Candidatus Limnocylindria bacterium]|nr:adenylate/guanylate cyclase domain-containing protein [Candidatus Limnocylindria bacterium]